MVQMGISDTVDSVRQAIRVILTTSKGEVPFRPRFGLGAENLLDGAKKNVDIAYEVVDQLTRYEKRIRVKQVKVTDIGVGQKTVEIHYTILIENKADILTIQL